MGVAEVISGIIAFFKAIPIMDDWLRQLIAAYIASEKSETISKIQDAAAMSLRAKTDEERFKAAAAWQSALQRNRVSI